MPEIVEPKVEEKEASVGDVLEMRKEYGLKKRAGIFDQKGVS
jgi:hypothetical protein